MVVFGNNSPSTAASFDPWSWQAWPPVEIASTQGRSYSFTLTSTHYNNNVEVWHSPRARRFRARIQRWADVAGCSFEEALRIFRRIGAFEVGAPPPPPVLASLIDAPNARVCQRARIPRLMVRSPGRSSRGHDNRRRYRPRRKATLTC